jgi:WD40-like Beta Propeller Repeat
MGFLSDCRRSLLACVVAVLAFGANAGIAAAAFPGQNGRIAFEQGGTIATMNPNGSLVSFLASGSDPSWSPDGTRIAFVCTPCASTAGAGHIWVMDFDGGNATDLGVAGLSPSWSPDNDHIAFQQGISIKAVSASSGASSLTTILPGAAGSHDYSQPAWSPDGKTITVTDTVPTVPRQSTIDVVPASGGSPTALTTIASPGQQDSGADWSPDGSALLFSRQGPGGVVLAEVPAGGGPTTTFPSHDSFTDPAFSPDGTQILATGHVFSVDIYKGPSGGTPGIELTNCDCAGHADWGPAQANPTGAPTATPVSSSAYGIYPPDQTGAKSAACASITALDGAPSCVFVAFDQVSVAGNTTLTSTSTGPAAPSGFSINGTYYTLHTTATFTTARVCIYDSGVTSTSVLLHYDLSGTATDVTDPGLLTPGTRICSIPLNSLSPFAIAQPAATDTTPPTISLSHTADGQNGWNVTAPVTVAVNATDPDGGLAGAPACTDAMNGGSPASLVVSASEPSYAVSVSGEGTHAINCTATDGPGNHASASDTVKIDTQPPVVSYTGNAGSYTVDESVSITCTNSDPTPGSGLASSTCENVAGPAYSFALGTNMFSADATDVAGNKGHGSVMFTVQVTPASLCQVTKQFVETSTHFGSLPPVVRAAIDAKLTAICTALANANLTNPQLKALAVAAYDKGVQFLAAFGWLTGDQAATLTRLAAGL